MNPGLIHNSAGPFVVICYESWTWLDAPCFILNVRYCSAVLLRRVGLHLFSQPKTLTGRAQCTVPDFRPKQAVSAESANFGRTFQYEVNCQNSLLWQKLAEIIDLAEISVSAEVSAFPGALFWFRCFGKKSV